MNRHISEQFDSELESVRLRLMTMAGLVEKQLQGAVQAFLTHDGGLATEVLAGDAEINRLEVELDDDCISIIALRQPAATDLRLLVCIMKAGTDLERVGDEADRIAKAALAAVPPLQPDNQHQHGRILRLSELVAAMLRRALDTFARLDVEAAYEVMAADAEVNDEYDAIIRSAGESMGRDPQQWLNILWTARALERIGDHAKNLCEYVVYMVKGKDVRHPGSLETG